MEFVEWLQQVRDKKGIDLRTLARKAKLNASTISRIERSIIDPSLSTMVRITLALDVSPKDFFRSIAEKSIECQLPDGQWESPVLTLHDMLQFEEHMVKNPEVFEELVTDKINQIQRALPREFKPSFDFFTAFGADGLFQLLMGSPFYSFNVHYPYLKELSINADAILDIFIKGGVIIRHDVGAYISLRVGEKGLQPIRGSEEAKILALRNTSLFDKGEREPSLSEITRADDHLSEQYEILLLSWAALENERIAKLKYVGERGVPEFTGQWWNLQCMKNGYRLLLVSRWLEALGLSDSQWLDEIRKQMND